MTLPIMDLDSWTLSQSIVVFSVCALVIAIAGTRITRVVDQLADRTGLGEATAGAVLLGAATSLSGSVLSVTAAYRGHPELAVSNALGGIAVQTFFLAIADMVYRRANLEHAAASAPNMMQNGLLIRLLTIEKHASQTMIETRLEFQGDGTASGGLCLRPEGLTGATQCFIV